MSDQHAGQSNSYSYEELSAARYALGEVTDCLKRAGVPLGIREKYVSPLGRWVADQVEHADTQGREAYCLPPSLRDVEEGVDADGEKLAPERHCLLCGDTILGRRRQATFCSAAHRRTYNSQQQNRRRKEARAGS